MAQLPRERRPSTQRPSTSRRTQGSRSSRPAPVAAAAQPSHIVYTPRAIVLGIALVALLMLVAVPGREWLAQRAEIERVNAGLVAQRAKVAELNQQAAAFNDPKQVEQIARERLHYTFPGQTNVIVAVPNPTPTPTVVKHGRAQVTQSDATWYSKLWSSTLSASK